MSIEHNIEQCNARLALYVKASGKTTEQVIRQKMGTGKGALSTELSKSLRTLAPAKGEITATQLAALASGRGLKISDSVLRAIGIRFQAFSDVATHQVLFGKFKRGPRATVTIKGQRLGFRQVLVRGELSRRESSRFFTSLSARLAQRGPVAQDTETLNFLGRRLGLATVTEKRGDVTGTLTIGGFGDFSQQAVHALSRSRGQEAIERAIGAVNADMLPYLQRKLGDAATEALKN